MYEENGFIFKDNTKSVLIGLSCNYDFGNSIEVPEGVTEIKENAFATLSHSDSINTVEIILPSSLRKIGKEAFAYVNQIEKITIKDGIEVIGKNAFVACQAKEINLPDSVRKIEQDAFKSALVEKINLKNVEVIGDNAFSKSSLKSVRIPKSVISLGTSAFINCKNLEKVSFFAKTNIPECCFAGCKKLREFNLYSKPEKIGEMAFYTCEKLTKFPIPETVEEIGAKAFAQTKLNRFIAPPSLRVIKSCAFYSCTELKEIDFSKAESLEIQEHAFRDTGITSLNIGPNVKAVGVLAFGCNKNLKTVYYAPDINDVPEHCFVHCPNLDSIVFSDGIQAIRNAAFENTGFTSLNKELKKIILIEPFAFACCEKLESVVLTNENLAFNECSFTNCNKLDFVYVASKHGHNDSVNIDSAFNGNNELRIFAPFYKGESKCIQNSFTQNDIIRLSEIVPMRDLSTIVDSLQQR